MRVKTYILFATSLVLTFICATFKISTRKLDAAQQFDKKVTPYKMISTIAPYASKQSASLILGYSDSASSWFRDVVSYADECFYIQVSEPPTIITYDGNYKQNDSFGKDTNKLRDRVAEEEQMEANTSIYSIYSDLLTCNFSSLITHYKESIVHTIVEMYVNRTALKYCSDEYAWNSTKCMKELRIMCLSNSQICIMTTDLSMHIVLKMMEHWSNLKVIIAVEEPYAILSSRLKDNSQPTGFDVQRDSNHLCTRMYQDFENTRLLLKWFPGRLKLLSFEAIKDSPFSAAGHIYEFLNLFLFTENVWFWVYSNIQRMLQTETYGHSNLTSSKFRRSDELTEQMSEAIYLSCNDVYYFI